MKYLAIVAVIILADSTANATTYTDQLAVRPDLGRHGGSIEGARRVRGLGSAIALGVEGALTTPGVALTTEVRMTDFKFDPRRTALLNVDMQNCFVENSPVAAPRGREILPRINKLAEVCRRRGALVIHTLHLVRPDGSNTGVMGVIIPAIAAGLINKGNKRAELHPEIIVGKNDILLEKPRYGAFHGTDLDLILRNRGIDTVIITGICTNVCCETTAREANMRDYKVFFISDGTATFNTPDASADQIQPIVLATLKAAFAQVENTASMIRKLEEWRSAAA